MRTSIGPILVNGAAFFAGATGCAGCAGQGDFAILGIALGWGAATVAAIGGIFFGLDKLAGWEARRAAAPAGIAKLIEDGDVRRIERILSDDQFSQADIGRIQSSVLESLDRLPPFAQVLLCKAVFLADGEPEHALVAINKLMAARVQTHVAFNALLDLLGAIEKKPDAYLGRLVAKLLIKFEWGHRGGVDDSELARAVAVTDDWVDVLILIGTLCTRIKLEYTQTTAHLWAALGHLSQKPYGALMVKDFLPPYLVDIEGFEVELPPRAG